MSFRRIGPLTLLFVVGAFIGIACGSEATATPANTVTPVPITGDGPATTTVPADPKDSTALKVSLSPSSGISGTQVVLTVGGLPPGETASITQDIGMAAQFTSAGDSDGFATALETFHGCNPDSNPLTGFAFHGDGAPGDPGFREASADFTIISPECVEGTVRSIDVPSETSGDIESAGAVGRYQFQLFAGETYVMETSLGTISAKGGLRGGAQQT